MTLSFHTVCKVAGGITLEIAQSNLTQDLAFGRSDVNRQSFSFWLEQLEPGVDWPAASTFGNILQRAGLTSPTRKKRRTTPYSEPFSEVTAPNQLWCMDFKGYFSTGDGTRCDPFTITDAHSRYLIRCQIVPRMDLSQVRAVCEAAMRAYGMPARIRTDNGAPFAGTGSDCRSYRLDG